MYALSPLQLNAVGAPVGWLWLDVDLRTHANGRLYAVAIDPHSGAELGIVQDDPIEGRKIVAMSTDVGDYEECVKDGTVLTWRPRKEDRPRVYLCLKQPKRA